MGETAMLHFDLEALIVERCVRAEHDAFRAELRDGVDDDVRLLVRDLGVDVRHVAELLARLDEVGRVDHGRRFYAAGL